MDTRTGLLYESAEAARLAGAPDEDIARVEPLDERTVRVESGPFKGRVYAVVNGRRGRRMRHLETR